MDAGGNLSFQGSPGCSGQPQVIIPYCSGGTVWFEWDVNGAPQGPYNTGVACGAPTHLSVYGGTADDTIDLSGVSAANGFTGINQRNLIDGGAGNDRLTAGPDPAHVRSGTGNGVILVRNGVSDFVDCTGGFDAVQTDQPGVDSLIGCANVDYLPAPPPPPPPPPGTSPPGSPPPGVPASIVFCGGQPATKVGTEGADVIAGSSGVDVIAGLGDNDRISGLGGKDTICGGDGNDKLKGGGGNDKLLGGSGKDTLKGGPGKDKLKGGPGKDTLLQ